MGWLSRHIEIMKQNGPDPWKVDTGIRLVEVDPYMDAATQRRSLIAFYFGTKVASGDVTSDQVIDSVARRAYTDLQRTIHGFGAHCAKAEIKSHIHATLRSFVVDLATCNSQGEFDKRHDQWCKSACELFGKFSHSDRGIIFHYGQAQKWLNMTLKYLAVLNHPEVQRAYGFLHVPVDKYVYNEADNAGVKRPPCPHAWSKLDREKYINYQHRLREMVASTPYSCPLDWEADVWITRATGLTT